MKSEPMREKKHYKQKVLVVLMKGINSFVNLNGCNLLSNKWSVTPNNNHILEINSILLFLTMILIIYLINLLYNKYFLLYWFNFILIFEK
jgi:hypothetical protein